MLACVGFASPTYAEDGYDLWLRYEPLGSTRSAVARRARSIVAPAGPSSATVSAAVTELRSGLSSMLGRPMPITDSLTDGSIVLLRLTDAIELPPIGIERESLGAEGYAIRSLDTDGRRLTLIAGNDDIGILYGAFALLRHLQTGHDLEDLDIASAPGIERRVLNHWDNLDGSVERGYAGHSIWDWWRLPDYVHARYTDYARANASIGINGVVLNNVNAQPEILTSRYIDKAAALASAFRPYGLRVYLAISFDAPIDIGGLRTADPLDETVVRWWQLKAQEIYSSIPDFGGFLVKADSEGQPGPQGYGRTHADGANMLAAALRPHGGVVFWRAFVYSPDPDADRVKQAYEEFEPLDGLFASNVIVQVKNGPLDFQPREPFHPLFGAMPHTPLAIELQITQEYLGFSTHLAFLGTLWAEALTADTYASGPGSTVARVVDGTLHDYTETGIAGVANIGTDRNWTGATFTQANWYAFGRLAWGPQSSPGDIAEEWLRMTFTNDSRFVEPVTAVMLRSREAVVDYMTPLGLAHLMGTGHHYGPAPWVDQLSRPDWTPWYYHRADSLAIGFDRTATGSNAVAQYAAPLAEIFSDLDTVPEKYLLWFHRLSWDYRLPSGLTLWQALVSHYDRGVAEVEAIRTQWSMLEEFVDADRFSQTATFLDIQLREAKWWRDACVAYFAAVSGRPLPDGVRPPEHTLEHYRQLKFPGAPGR